MKMNRKCLILLPLAGLFLFFHYGCNKDEESESSKSESSNSLVYEDETLLDQVSPYFYDNHIYRIELLGANQEREQIVREALENGVEEEFLMIDQAQKYFFNHTAVIMYSIPTLDPEQTLILYETGGLYQVSMAHYRPAERGLMYFELKTMDDHNYFSLKLDDQMRMGELKVFENEKIKSFNSAVYSLTYMDESQEKSLKGAEAECCRKESSWKACMNCTLDDCSSSWLCKATSLIAPVELVAAFAASCIGAGPDSRC
ncbi:MAG: hypothetical protein P1P86_02620 [Bacteroidales bacterium]|nr:hypothetical protein [Bacteroidales bacterium]